MQAHEDGEMPILKLSRALEGICHVAGTLKQIFSERIGLWRGE